MLMRNSCINFKLRILLVRNYRQYSLEKSMLTRIITKFFFISIFAANGKGMCSDIWCLYPNDDKTVDMALLEQPYRLFFFYVTDMNGR